MKIPKDSPTKEGQRVVHRGASGKKGVITQRTRSASWLWVKWDDFEKQMLCHQSELKVEEAP